MTAPVVVAEAIDVTKHFGSTVALENVTLTINAGESHALVGRNGAGKSTLVSLLTGMTAPDGGSIRLAGTPAAAISDRAWWRRNVACVYQRSTIVPALTVAENLFLNRQSDGAVINWSDLERRAAALLREYEVDVDVTAIAGSLDVEARQMVEIARALSGGARFIILDEPTAKLDGKAVARLFRRMRTLQAGGVTFLYISHHLEEIANICETVTVLRDARHVVTARTSELSRDALVEAITGEPKGTRQRRVRTTVDPAQRPVLVIEGLGLPGQFESASLDVRAGEILGLAGSASSGATALAECVAGLRRPASGHIAVGGRTVTAGNVPASLAAGIGFVPPDRQTNGFVPGLGVAENMTMPITPRLGRFGVIMGRRRDSIAGRLSARLAVKASSLSQPVGSLSGGNQQKVVMGRAISGEPRVLVLVNPTAGIDVRSKESLIEVIEDGAIGGQAVLVVTDDLEDLRSCDRVLVMFRGVITKEFRGQWLDHDLVSAIEGLGVHTDA